MRLCMRRISEEYCTWLTKEGHEVTFDPRIDSDRILNEKTNQFESHLDSIQVYATLSNLWSDYQRSVIESQKQDICLLEDSLDETNKYCGVIEQRLERLQSLIPVHNCKNCDVVTDCFIEYHHGRLTDLACVEFKLR